MYHNSVNFDRSKRKCLLLYLLDQRERFSKYKLHRAVQRDAHGHHGSLGSLVVLSNVFFYLLFVIYTRGLCAPTSYAGQKYNENCEKHVANFSQK